MKALKTVMVVMIAVACIMSVLPAKEAHAAFTWLTVYVNSTGQTGSQKIMTVTDATGTVPSVNRTTYRILATYDNAILVTALSAMTSGMKCQIYVNAITENSIIYSCLLLDK
jgi:hypothetical protein